jgi:hypothetical protein
MEYTINSGTTWIPISATTLELAAKIPASSATTGATLQLRTKASGTSVASDVYSFVLPARGAAPDVAILYSTNSIYGVDTTMQYKVDSGTWSDVDGTSMDISSIIAGPTGAIKKVSIRVKASSTAPASDTVIVNVAKRAAAPAVSADNVKNILKGITYKMEYSTNGGTSWTTYNVSTPPDLSGSATVVVRTKATATLPASEKTGNLTFN